MRAGVVCASWTGEDGRERTRREEGDVRRTRRTRTLTEAACTLRAAAAVPVADAASQLARLLT
eukprot:5857946-Prymnesium_polylepis.1